MLGYCIFSKSIHTSRSSVPQFDSQVQWSLLRGVNQFLLCKKKSVICLPTKHVGVLMRSRSNWNLEVLVLEERGKPECPDKNLSEQTNKPTTNSTNIWRQCWDLNRGHIGGRWLLSPLGQPPLLPRQFWYAWILLNYVTCDQKWFESLIVSGNSDLLFCFAGICEDIHDQIG